MQHRFGLPCRRVSLPRWACALTAKSFSHIARSELRAGALAGVVVALALLAGCGKDLGQLREQARAAILEPSDLGSGWSSVPAVLSDSSPSDWPYPRWSSGEAVFYNVCRSVSSGVATQFIFQGEAIFSHVVSIVTERDAVGCAGDAAAQLGSRSGITRNISIPGCDSPIIVNGPKEDSLTESTVFVTHGERMIASLTFSARASDTLAIEIVNAACDKLQSVITPA